MAPLNRSQLRDLLNDHGGRELEVGFALLAVSREDKLPGRHESLRSLIDAHEGLDYSTAMRWMRAAEVLDGPEDPRREWGVSRLAELARIHSADRRASILASHDLAKMSVRDVRQLVSEQVRYRRAAPQRGEANDIAVLRRAIDNAIRRRLPQRRSVRARIGQMPDGVANPNGIALVGGPIDEHLGQASVAAGEVITAVSVARSVWRRSGRAEARYWWAAGPDVIASLPPGQLGIRLTNHRDHVEILRDGQAIVTIPITRCDVSEIAKPEGNQRSGGVLGILDTITSGCLRAATGLPGTDRACFQTDDGGSASGCFANYPEYVRHGHVTRADRRGGAFDIVSNGLTNNLMRIRLPADGSRDLSWTRRERWLVDADSADGSLSIALGFLQCWAEANPRKWFTTTCSHAIRPSDEMLSWLSALPNVLVGHTLSASFSPRELAMRFGAIERFRDWGIPCVISITTHRSWDNQPVVDRARRLIRSWRPIAGTQGPYSTQDNGLPLLHIHPLGAVSGVCHDRWGLLHEVRAEASGEGQAQPR